MQLAWSPEDEAFRAELVEFLDRHCPPEALAWARTRQGEGQVVPEWARRWQATLFDHGWMVPGYPPELGGRDATSVQTLIYLEELASRDVPRSLHFPGYAIVAPSLLEFGDEEQQRLVPAAVRGDTVWCIGMSEPDAGSDLASLQTRAVRRGDHFVVNGQKVWTSYAMVAEKCMCYVRTTPIARSEGRSGPVSPALPGRSGPVSPALPGRSGPGAGAPKHRGISVLLVDMDTPGVEVRPIRHITGAEEFAEVYFTDVEVPAANLVGEPNDGWRVTTGSLAHERGGLWVQGVARARQAVDELAELARRRGLAGDPGVRRRIAEAYQRASSLRALGYKGFAGFAQGGSAPEHSYMKLAHSELQHELYELGMELLGPFGVVTGDERADGGSWSRRFFVTFASKIAGGTSEIQRNIIAQRVLGLPRG